MNITIHAAERIQGRTKLSLKDVLSRLNSGKALEIECPGSIRFLLFFSQRDACTKLALVDKRENTLVSVWEDTYFLPRGRKVTNAERAKAYSLAFPGVLNVEIHVHYEEQLVHVAPAGEIAKGDSRFLDTTVVHVAARLRSLVEVVSEQAAEIRGRTKYYFQFSDPETKAVLTVRHCVSHKRVDSFLPGIDP